MHKILVTPVLALLSKSELVNSLAPSPQEVSHIFHHPLEAILDPGIAKHGPLTEIGENWPYESEVYVCYCHYFRGERYANNTRLEHERLCGANAGEYLVPYASLPNISVSH